MILTWEVVLTVEGSEGLQRDLDKIGRLDMISSMNFNKGKCQVLQLGWIHVQTGRRMTGEHLRRNGLGGASDSTSQQYALVDKWANCILGCTEHSIAN